MNPKVSIIIPVYNGSNFVAEAVKSAVNQTYESIEIIVVNDGSSDDGATRRIIDNFGATVRYYEKENGGVSSALNYGISKMTGEYFSWLSHDDLYYNYKISSQVEYLKTKNNKTIVYSSEDLIDSKSNIIKKANVDKVNNKNLAFELLHNRFIGGCSLLIPSNAFDVVGCFNESLKAVQDYEMWFRMIFAGYNFEYLPIISGASRIHNNQVSVAKKKMCFEEDSYVFKKIIDEIPKDKILGNGEIYADKLYTLSYEFKRKGRVALSKYCYVKARSEAILTGRLSIKTGFLKYRVLLWNRYISFSMYKYWLRKLIDMLRCN